MRAADQGAQARLEFAERKRLDQVVVGAGVEPGDAVFEAIARDVVPRIVVQTNGKKAVALLISSMSASYTPEYCLIMAAIALATLPVIVLFFALQKQFVQGMLGSVKG
mgnify:CR=1 FL=1